MQTAGVAAGGYGEGIGLGGILGSVGVCVDTFSGTTPNLATTNVYLNGSVPQYDSSSPDISTFPLTNGQRWLLQVNYLAGVMTWAISLPGSTFFRTFNATIGPIKKYLGDNVGAYWGFTAAVRYECIKRDSG